MSSLARRTFLHAGAAGLAGTLTRNFGVAQTQALDDLFTIQLDVAHRGYDGTTCWVHARAGAIPFSDPVNDAPRPIVVLTMQKLLLEGSDVYYALHAMHSTDLGVSWTSPTAQAAFMRQTVRSNRAAPVPTGAKDAFELLQEGDQTTVCDFVPKWHAASERILGLGQTVWYRENRVLPVRPRGITYATYDLESHQWTPWSVVGLPADPRFQNAGAGSAQRVDLVGGDLLIPFYFKEPRQRQYSVTVAHCRFDGKSIELVELGNELTIAIARGLYEPSLTQFNGTYFLTMRNDQRGFVSTSLDGIHFQAPRPWSFDDGKDLGNYNTQQHWVTHDKALYLVYTRRGADNDHVFRHRAPLFIGQVDPKRLQIVRATEQVLVPEHGARLGNFGVTDVSDRETWISVAEWMQPKGAEKFGSDNRIFLARLKWKQPNRHGRSPADSAQDAHFQTPWQTIRPYFNPPAKRQDRLGNYRSPLQFESGQAVRTAEQWQQRRDEILTQWTDRLGAWPPLIVDPESETLSTTRRDELTQIHIRFRWTPDEVTTGYLLVPQAPTPRPAVLTVYYEPETAIGRGRPYRDFALQLGRRGFVTLSIGTTEATESKTYGLFHPNVDRATVEPLSMLAYAAANAWHLLARRPEVDSQRIGIVGHSYGGKWAMFASCLFQKFACAAWSDPGIVFDESRPNVNYWEPWYLGYHPRPWRPRGRITPDNPARGLYPRLRQDGRDLHELHALMAPRPFLVSGGAEDPLDRWDALNHSIAVNRLLGKSNRVAMTNRPDHSPNRESNEVIYAFFEHFLQVDGQRRTP